MIKTVKILLLILGLGIICNSCVPVKAYQKMYLNDSEMTLSSRKVEHLQDSYLNYREGASGGNGGKTGGGCGCN